MTKIEVQRLKERLQAEYRKKLDALALVEQMLQEEQIALPANTNNGHGNRVLEPEIVDDEEGDSDTLIGRIQNLFVSDPEKRWTVSKIEQAVKSQGYKFQGAKASTSIHTTLSKLKLRKVVRTVKHGKGSKPSVYAAEKQESANA
jgi:hypothetical protein